MGSNKHQTRKDKTGRRERLSAERDPISLRAVELGEYIVATGSTVRGAAQKFGVSKSTVHKDIAERLFWIDRPLYRAARRVLDLNKAQRHLRGGLEPRRHAHRHAPGDASVRQCRGPSARYRPDRWPAYACFFLRHTGLCPAHQCHFR